MSTPPNLPEVWGGKPDQQWKATNFGGEAVNGPIDRFLHDLGNDADAESLKELKDHLEESADALIELGLGRSEAERAAIGLLGEHYEVRQAVKRRLSVWSFLFGGDRRIRVSVWAAMSLFIILNSIISATSVGSDTSVLYFAGFGFLLMGWTLYQSMRASRVGPLAVSFSMVAGVLTGVFISSLLFGRVPMELGHIAWRWELNSKYSEFMAYQGEFWNSAVDGYYSRMNPGKLSYKAAKQDMWAITGGLGVFGTFKFWLTMYLKAYLYWLMPSVLGGVCGFFVRLFRRGGIRFEKGLREE